MISEHHQISPQDTECFTGAPDSEIKIEIISKVTENEECKLTIAECQKRVMEEFRVFARKIGTLFDRAELLVNVKKFSANNNPECRTEILLLNRLTYQSNGASILCLLVKMFDASLTTYSDQKKAGRDPYQDFSQYCQAIGFYRGRPLTDDEQNAVDGLICYNQNSFRKESISATLDTALPFPPIESLPTISMQTAAEGSDGKRLKTNKHLHSYPPLTYKLHSIDFKNKIVSVKINDKPYYVSYLDDLLGRLKTLVIEYIGKNLILREIREHRNKNVYEVVTSLVDGDEHQGRDICLSKFNPDTISFHKDPSIFSARSKRYYVDLPNDLLGSMRELTKKTFGQKIALKESGKTCQGHRCHILLP